MTVRAHEKTHLNIEYICDLCGSSFRVKAYLTAHVQKVHMKLKKWDLLLALMVHDFLMHPFLYLRFKCSFENCSAAFVHRELLNYHVRKHLNIRNFACRYCGKTFTTKNCCTIHERLEHFLNYSSQFCVLILITPRIHTDERPYSCRFCERTFIHHSDHRRHELKHVRFTLATIIKKTLFHCCLQDSSNLIVEKGFVEISSTDHWLTKILFIKTNHDRIV